MRGLLGAFLAETALVTWRDLHTQKVLPPPSDYAAVIIIFSFLGLVSESDALAPAAAAVGWMVALSTFLKLWDPTDPTKSILTPTQTSNLYQAPAVSTVPTTSQNVNGGS